MLASIVDALALSRLLLSFGVVLAMAYIVLRAVIGLASFQTPPAPRLGSGRRRFLVIVPARDEERVIAATVSRLLALDYPADRCQVVVVADSCVDATADVAQAAGASVLVRTGSSRGKGEVIRWALGHPDVIHAYWDAFVLLDADSAPRPDFLRVVEGALDDGARSIQGRTTGLRGGNWLSRAYSTNATIRNRLWHLARERIGSSAALTGTGICITRETLEAVPWRTHTLTEDLEYGALLELAGIRTHFLFHALVEIEEPLSVSASVRQRLRWARGQVMTALELSPRLVAYGLRRRRFSAIELATYLFMPTVAPLQWGLMMVLALQVIVPELTHVPPASMLATLFVSFAVIFAGSTKDKATVSPRDWLGYVLLMLTWLPVAFVGALTMRTFSWQPTPHGVSEPVSAAKSVDGE